MGFAFSLVDVLTDRPFDGSQFAVFPYATGIADATMQQLAGSQRRLGRPAPPLSPGPQTRGSVRRRLRGANPLEHVRQPR